MEDAVRSSLTSKYFDLWELPLIIYVTTGRRALKVEKDSWCEHDYIVDVPNCIKVEVSENNKMPGCPEVIY